MQVARAISAGDPPAVQSAYTTALLAKAPYYKQEQVVFKYATPRPVSPVYTEISSQLQTMISSVLSGQETPSAALSATAPTVQATAADRRVIHGDHPETGRRGRAGHSRPGRAPALDRPGPGGPGAAR